MHAYPQSSPVERRRMQSYYHVFLLAVVMVYVTMLICVVPASTAAFRSSSSSSSRIIMATMRMRRFRSRPITTTTKIMTTTAAVAKTTTMRYYHQQQSSSSIVNLRYVRNCCSSHRRQIGSSSSLLFSKSSTDNDDHQIKHEDKKELRKTNTPTAKKTENSTLLSSFSDDDDDDDDEVVPLIFVHGMKGSHLAFYRDDNGNNNNNLDKKKMEDNKQKQRSWLTLGSLLNFPPKDDDHPDRDISLPLSYSSSSSSNRNDSDFDSTSSFPIQDRGSHFVDGVVNHIVELSTMTMVIRGDRSTNNNSKISSIINRNNKNNNFDFFPFYGHVTKFLEDINDAYINNNKEKRTTNNTTHTSYFGNEGDGNDNNNKDDDDDIIAKTKESMVSSENSRPTRSFCYDWRRNLFEVTKELHDYIDKEFPNPNTKVQIVAHSLGGLITYAAMKQRPERFEPGAVIVGVPFGTGIQYLQDMHKGYYTELGTCRQFLPPTQFTFSSHWSFFPTNKKELGDTFVDVTDIIIDDEDDDDSSNNNNFEFVPDASTIGKNSSTTPLRRPAIAGNCIDIDFYNPDEWEKHEIGIFDPYYRNQIETTSDSKDANDDEKTTTKVSDNKKRSILQYKEHMKKQMDDAKRWRKFLGPINNNNENNRRIPPIIVCSTNTVPTVNQVLRRRRRFDTSTDQSNKIGGYEYFSRSLLSLFENKIRKDGAVEMKIDDDDNDSTTNNQVCRWEYDYSSGRTCPGDGRIDYDKSFPPDGVDYNIVDLTSLHAKQFCWEENGGNLGLIMKQVNDQLLIYSSSKKTK